MQNKHSVAKALLWSLAFLSLWGCSHNPSGAMDEGSDLKRPKTERDKACEEFGVRHRKQLGADFKFDKITDFYSEKLDTCVEARESQIENTFVVVDISGGFIKPMLDGFGDMGQGLFGCDSSGVDHALIEKVRDHHGYVDKVPYDKWMDDFKGGPPRTVKSAPKMLSRGDCEEWFKKELRELR
jgi:hypothetical protein